MIIRIADTEDIMCIYELVQKTIREIYPVYYLPEIVDMFCEYHGLENIGKDIRNGNTYAALEENMVVGTGTVNGNHITRVYVLPAFQGKGIGSFLMRKLEDAIDTIYDKAEVDASLPACSLYYKLGYTTVNHGIWKCANNVIQVYEIMEKKIRPCEEEYGGLRLRPYKPCDAETIVSWIPDEVTLRKWSADRFGEYPITAADMNEKYYDCNGDCDESDNFYPLTAFNESGVAGHLFMRFMDENKQIVRFGFVIVDNKKRGSGYGRKMLKLALKYAFEVLMVTKVTLGVFANNNNAYHCYKSVGFNEIVMEEDIYYNVLGENWKCIEMEILREK